MKLLFIYGPPAVGKLTIGKEVSRLTGFKLFHNHLTYDLGREIFPHGDKRLWKLIDKLRLDFFEAASESDISGMIFTLVYTPDDNGFVDKVVESIRKNGGQTLFVKLTCDEEELLKRVTHESRKGNKLTDPNELKRSLSKWDFKTPVPYEENIIINTTNTQPEEVAKKIIGHYHLPII